MKIVFYDLETTDLNHRTAHEGVQICAMAAIYKDKVFKRYMIPTSPINPGAAKVNGFALVNGKLYLRGQPVQAVPIPDGLKEFQLFLLNEVKAIRPYEPVILVAHNNFKFDGIVLKKNFRDSGLNFPPDVSFADTRDVVLKAGLYRNSLDNCLNHFFNERQGHHDALKDTQDCQRIAQKAAEAVGYPSFEEFLAKNERMYVRDVPI